MEISNENLIFLIKSVFALIFLLALDSICHDRDHGKTSSTYHCFHHIVDNFVRNIWGKIEWEIISRPFINFWWNLLHEWFYSFNSCSLQVLIQRSNVSKRVESFRLTLFLQKCLHCLFYSFLIHATSHGQKVKSMNKRLSFTDLCGRSEFNVTYLSNLDTYWADGKCHTILEGLLVWLAIFSTS